MFAIGSYTYKKWNFRCIPRKRFLAAMFLALKLVLLLINNPQENDLIVPFVETRLTRFYWMYFQFERIASFQASEQERAHFTNQFSLKFRDFRKNAFPTKCHDRCWYMLSCYLYVIVIDLIARNLQPNTFSIQSDYEWNTFSKMAHRTPFDSLHCVVCW